MTEVERTVIPHHFFEDARTRYSLGAAHAYLYPNYSGRDVDYVASLWVPHGLRRQGLARQIMQAICDDADERSAMLALVCAPDDVDSEPAINRFYRSFGFLDDTMVSMNYLGYPGYMIRKPVASLLRSV